MKKYWIILLMAGLCGMAQAAVTVNVNEVGSDVVFDWYGSLNITGATLEDTFGGAAAIVNPSMGLFQMYSSGNTYAYSLQSAPSGMGDGGWTWSTTSSGNATFLINSQSTYIGLGQFYVSGSSIYGTNTIASKTIADIGLNSGTYNWTMTGSGDTITMNVIPEPASALLIGCGAALIAAVRRVSKFYSRI